MQAAETKARINQYIWSYNPCDPTAPRSWLRHFLQIMSMVGTDLMGGMLTLRSMSLVYTTLLSIVPLLAVSISVLKGFGVHNQLEPTLVSLLAPLGERSAEISSRIVEFVDNMKIGVLGALGLSMLIFTVVSLIQKIESAFNYTWRLQSSRNLMQRFSNYLSVVLVGPVFIFSAVGITASLSSNTVMTFINALPYMSDLVKIAGKLIPYMLIISVFTFIYILVPNTRVKPKSALFGAVISGLLWETSGVLFTSFIGGSTNSYTAIYSGFAIMLMFMIWLYLSWLILLIGSSITYYHQHPERLKWKKKDFNLSAGMHEQLILQLMVNIGRSYDQQSNMPTTMENLANYQQVPIEIIERMLTALLADGLILPSSDEVPRYIPGRSLNRIGLVDILRSSRMAEDDNQRSSLFCDPSVASLIRSIENEYENHLGNQTLADFLNANPEPDRS